MTDQGRSGSPSGGSHFDPVQCIARAIVARRLGPFAAAGPSNELLRDALADAEAILEELDRFGGLVVLARALLERRYPVDVFDASSGDPGARLAAALREVVDVLSA